MSVLSEQRLEIKTALKVKGLAAFTTVPAKWTPPGVFIGPGDPYISHEGAAFGSEIIHHQVTAVVAAGTNDVRADDLDDLILDVLDVLYGLEAYDVGDVQRPGQINVNGQLHLAVAIDLSTEIRR